MLIENKQREIKLSGGAANIEVINNVIGIYRFMYLCEIIKLLRWGECSNHRTISCWT